MHGPETRQAMLSSEDPLEMVVIGDGGLALLKQLFPPHYCLSLPLGFLLAQTDRQAADSGLI